MCGVFQRGVFRELGPSHRLRLRVLSTARDAESACGNDEGAAEAAEAWLEAARPIAELIDPAALCHGLVTYANTLRAGQVEGGEEEGAAGGETESSTSATRAEKARAALEEAEVLARITRGDADALVAQIAQLRGATACPAVE